MYDNNGSLSLAWLNFFNGLYTSATAGSTVTLTGDVTGTGIGTVPTTLATVNSNVGTYGTATQVSSLTVNGKGLITGVSNTNISIPVSAIYDINSWVGSTSLTTVGTISTGVWNGTKISEIYGGTNQNSYSLGDILYSSATNTLSKLSGNITTTKQFLSQTGTGTVSAAPSWSTLSSTDVGLSNVPNVDCTNASNISSGTLSAGRMPALTGDITTSAGTVATTLATVNSNVGTFGSSTNVPTFTVNAKGLITAASNNSVTIPVLFPDYFAYSYFGGF